MKKPRLGPVYLPALRGIMGTNIYYVTLMTLDQVSDRIRIGQEIHKSEGLSDMVQRALKDGRDHEIASYLQTVNERFFNAMVVGVYGGRPDWKPFPLLNSHESVDVSALPLDTINSFGFLELSGGEKLFPLDGQHRLVGVQCALKEASGSDLGTEEMTVIFLAHDKDTKAGRERSRRLFTVLNKRAKPVDKNEIIALDEDDAMAIVTRMLVEDYAPLKGERVLYSASSTMPSGQAAFTTIGALYDCMGFLFPKLTGLPRRTLENVRPSDEGIEYLWHCAKRFFDGLQEVPEFKAYVKAVDPKAAAAKSRNTTGGNLLFRPVGLKIFGEITADLLGGFKAPEIDDLDDKAVGASKTEATKHLDQAMAIATRLPMSLSAAPYRGFLWDATTHRMQAGRAALMRDLLLHQLGRFPERKLPRLRTRYAQALGKDPSKVRLPTASRKSS